MIKIDEKSLLSLLDSSLKADNISRVVVGGLIKNKNGQVLVLKRSATDFMGGLDELPSGKMDPEDKTVIDALKREIKEETNLVVISIESYLGSFDYNSKSGTRTRQFNFSVQVADPECLQISDEHQSSNWYSIFDIHLSNMTNNVREFLTREFENQLIEQARKENVKRICVGGLVADPKCNVLVLRKLHANDGGDDLPNGEIKNDETLSQALIRVLKEKTNLTTIEPIKRYIAHFDTKSDESGELTRQFNFEISATDLSELKVSDEYKTYTWYSSKNKRCVNKNASGVINKYINDSNSVNSGDKKRKATSPSPKTKRAK